MNKGSDTKAQITYADKSAMNVNSTIPDINKVNASDMNEIKSVVNENYTEFLNAINDKNIISASITSNYTLTSTNSYIKLPLNTSLSAGTRLTLDSTNHNVVVGAGVSKVKISAKVSFNSVSASGVKWLSIFKNSETPIANPRTITARDMIYSTDTIVEVQQNDNISIQIIGNNGDVIRNGIGYTNITIEVIE